MKYSCKVLVVSRLRITGEALTSHLEQQGDRYEVIYSSCLQDDGLPPDFLPDVVVMACLDDCLAEAQSMLQRFPAAKCLVITRSPDLYEQIHWIRSGILGIIDETRAESDLDHVENAIAAVRNGQVWAPRRVLSQFVLDSGLPRKGSRSVHLTPREREMLSYVRMGLSNAAIAGRLGISEKTVKGHLTRTYRKLKVENRVQATLKAVELGEPAGSSVSAPAADPGR
jgi:DNA-binding NarL/FixJ family response regulator